MADNLHLSFCDPIAGSGEINMFQKTGTLT